jgi:2,3-bisphosphoglycerate-dependent phosphoglycerate mutase
MSVGFKVGSMFEEIGTPDFLHAFFSTASCRLEPNGWGTRFPELMCELYQGKLHAFKAEKALDDLSKIREELKSFKPNQVVWDINKRTAVPPWGSNISPEITDLSNYFVTSTGKDLIEVLSNCLLALKERKGWLTIEGF